MDVNVVRTDLNSYGGLTQVCTSAYTGPRCVSCAEGYYQLNSMCYYCGSAVDQSRDIALTLLVASVAMITLALAVALLNANRLARVIQGFVVLQGVALVGVDGVKNIPWQTQNLSTIFTYLNWINFDRQTTTHTQEKEKRHNEGWSRC